MAPPVSGCEGLGDRVVGKGQSLVKETLDLLLPVGERSFNLRGRPPQVPVVDCQSQTSFWNFHYESFAFDTPVALGIEGGELCESLGLELQPATHQAGERTLHLPDSPSLEDAGRHRFQHIGILY